MALKWVKALKVIHRTDDGGQRVTYYKGDWFQARNMEIRQRLASGEIVLATDLGRSRIYEVEKCGVVTANSEIEVANLGLHGTGLEITYTSDFILKYPYTLFWDGSPVRNELLPTSFELLKTWEIAVPLEDFSITAERIGTEEDRLLTKEVLGDLRVPVYNTSQVYAKRCSATRKLLSSWVIESSKVVGGDTRLAFLRALYVNPLLILALPPSWIVGISE